VYMKKVINLQATDFTARDKIEDTSSQPTS